MNDNQHLLFIFHPDEGILQIKGWLSNLTPNTQNKYIRPTKRIFIKNDVMAGIGD